MIPLRRPSPAPHTAVLLLQLGGPDSLEAVEPFLENLFRDPFLIRIPFLKGPLRRWFARVVARRRAPHVRGLYTEIGGRSPIRPLTEAQAQRLEEELGPGFRCYVAFAAWTPYIQEAVAQARADGCTRLVGVSLFPQWCSATTESRPPPSRAARALASPSAASASSTAANIAPAMMQTTTPSRLVLGPPMESPKALMLRQPPVHPRTEPGSAAVNSKQV